MSTEHMETDIKSLKIIFIYENICPIVYYRGFQAWLYFFDII